MFKKSVSFIVILLCLSSSINGAQFTYERLINENQDYISDIKTLGSWVDGDKRGYYRIIYVEVLYGCSWLYIQWMKGYSPSGLTKAYHTLSIYDNDHHENMFSKPEYKQTKDGLVINYIATNGHDGKDYKVEIKVYEKLGKHEINSALIP